MFKDVIGQNNIKQRLIDSVQSGRVAHAQLFYGSGGTGTLPMALAYAQYICCKNRTESDSCGVCPSCRAIEKLAHPDLHFVFPINDSKAICDEFMPNFRTALLENQYITFDEWQKKLPKETVAVIYTREGEEIIRKLNYKSFQSDYKIMIIWCADRMNEELANKILKILEEPMGQTVFMLVTDKPDKIISTIISRTQPLFFPPLTQDDLRNALKTKGIYFDENNIDFLLKNAKGSWVELLKNIEQKDEQKEFFELFMLIMRISWLFKVENMSELNQKISKMGRSSHISFLQFSQRILRECFIFNFKNDNLSYINNLEKDFINNFSKFINETNIEKLMNEFALAEAHIEQNGNAKIIFFDLMIKINLGLKGKL
ncbi:MAG: DNA polymerase III subunit [Prevotellaceae bacterium]|jgi:DNA polymerase-3 subunit delta'|nr:DNA polymerase III subunit [Prevotellaceae bacterium]